MVTYVDIDDHIETVIDFVNWIRVDNGFGHIEHLYKGNPGDAESDTIVRSIQHNASPLACAAFHDTIGVYSWDTGENRVYRTPDYVREFMQQFDRGEIPELEIK